MKKITLSLFALLASFQIFAQVDDAKVYWVGHSLMSHTDSYETGTDNLLNLLDAFAASQGKNYDGHQHTTPGAPIGWNWGANPTAWSDIETIIQPLTNSSHSDYGTYNAMIITEGVNLQSSYDWWSSGFYARKFYNAAKNANPDTRLFLYESWHHYHASDETFRDYYGPMATFDWRQYMLDIHSTWEDIADEASDPALTQAPSDYTYQGTGTDPGLGNDLLDIHIIPTGQVLVQVLDRLASNLASDDWTFKGRELRDVDFFANPLTNYPTDLSTTVHPSDPIDDIHPSHVLIYLNALVHYAVVYQENPGSLPATNGVPSNIANIFKEIVWNIVINDPRTGVSESLSVDYASPLQLNLINKGVQLTWTTSNEINHSHFEIERSSDQLAWKAIGQASAKTPINGSNQYTAIDANPLNGQSYYRLKQVDLDGTFTYSNVAGIYFENDFKISPNPSSDFLNIEIEKSQPYRIIGLHGRTLLQGRNKKVDLTSLNSGIYFIQIGERAKRFLKELGEI